MIHYWRENTTCPLHNTLLTITAKWFITGNKIPPALYAMHFRQSQPSDSLLKRKYHLSFTQHTLDNHSQVIHYWKQNTTCPLHNTFLTITAKWLITEQKIPPVLYTMYFRQSQPSDWLLERKYLQSSTQHTLDNHSQMTDNWRENIPSPPHNRSLTCGSMPEVKMMGLTACSPWLSELSSLSSSMGWGLDTLDTHLAGGKAGDSRNIISVSQPGKETESVWYNLYQSVLHCQSVFNISKLSAGKNVKNWHCSGGFVKDSYHPGRNKYEDQNYLSADKEQWAKCYSKTPFLPSLHSKFISMPYSKAKWRVYSIPLINLLYENETFGLICYDYISDVLRTWLTAFWSIVFYIIQNFISEVHVW